MYFKHVLSVVFLLSSLWGNYFSGEAQLRYACLDDVLVDGLADLDRTEVSSLTVNGSLKFVSLKVQKDAVIKGSAEGEDLKCGNLKVNGSFQGEKIEAPNIQVSGSLEVSHLKCNGPLKVSGSLALQDSHVHSIDFTGTDAVLENVKTNSIVVRPTKSGFSFLGFQSSSVPQKITLKGPHTIISGDITFESGKGEVSLLDMVQIQGRVTGGKVIKR